MFIMVNSSVIHKDIHIFVDNSKIDKWALASRIRMS